MSKWETIQIHSTNRDIAADNDRRLLSRVASRKGDCAIQFKRLHERPFGVVFLGRFPHQAGVNHEQVSAGVILQQLDRSLHHVRKIRLLAALFDLICERQLRIVKSAKKLRPPPRRDRLQLRSSTNDIKTVAAELEQKIASVLSLAPFCSGKKLRRAASHRDIDLSSIDELSRNLLDIVWIDRMRIKSSACRIGQFCVCHEASGASIFAS